jgi:hypothetical protein
MKMTFGKLEQIKLRLTGTRPLLLCRGEGANPFDPQAREMKRVSQKRNKTDEDHELLARLQFESSCYFDEQIGIYMPCDNFFKALQEGAAKYKESKLVKSLVIVKGFVGKELDNGAAKLIYDGPKDIDGLYAKKQFVSLRMGKPPGQRASILISRPIFQQWALEYLLEFSELTKERLVDYATVAGRMIGLGSWRPQHGLFTVEVLK